MLYSLKFDRTPLDIAIGNGRADLVQILQLAQVLCLSSKHTMVRSPLNYCLQLKIHVQCIFVYNLSIIFFSVVSDIQLRSICKSYCLLNFMQL